MADPFTIIGATAALLQFSEFAGKVIHTAYGLYSSASGQSATNESIGIVTTKLSDLLDALSAVQDQSLVELVAHCRTLGETLLALLEKTKAKRDHSLRESFKAGMKTVWTKSTVEDLRKSLDSCVNLLGVYLVNTFRSETGTKLEEILNVNNSQNLELSLLRQTLVKISNNQKLAFDSVIFLREIFSPSDVVLWSLNQERILKSLAFDGMGSRFGQVSQSERGTFNWCLEDTDVPESHPELEISFREWLVRGHGIFHISAKPGAGKSTLMRFIVDHTDTRQYLHQWAGTRDLVTANTFFWKPGKPLEKSLEGLIRSIVYTILKTLPDTIPMVFPLYWDPNAASPWQAVTDLEIPFHEIYRAFETLVGDLEGMKGHCFCFFIDGLDEFDDPEMQQHTKLAVLLKSWTDSNPDNIKICVSSREENSFMTTFFASQRLRLHLLTQNDIERKIANSLNGHPNFSKYSPKDRQLFILAMLKRAEGVFLWVKLVLNELWQDLDEGCFLDDLYETLKLVPRELEDIFQRILNSIRPKDQKEAWALIFMIMDHTNLLRPRGHEGRRLSILHYSFVKELIGNKRRINEPEISPTTRKAKFEQHVRGLFKGLVEIDAGFELRPLLTNLKLTQLEQSSKSTFENSLAVTHRSVYEFLGASCPKEMEDFVSGLDIDLITLQCIIAHVKLAPWDRYMPYVLSGIILRFLVPLVTTSCSPILLGQLGILDDILMHQQDGCSVVEGFDWSIIRAFELNYAFKPNEAGCYQISILAYSFYLGFEEYATWTRQNRPAWISGHSSRARLWQITLNRAFMLGMNESATRVSEGQPLSRLLQSLDDFIDSGVATAAGTIAWYGRSLSLWQWFIAEAGLCMCHDKYEPSHTIATACGIFLDARVDTYAIFRLWYSAESEANSSELKAMSVEFRNIPAFRIYGSKRDASWTQRIVTFRSLVPLMMKILQPDGSAGRKEESFPSPPCSLVDRFKEAVVKYSPVVPYDAGLVFPKAAAKWLAPGLVGLDERLKHFASADSSIARRGWRVYLRDYNTLSIIIFVAGIVGVFVSALLLYL